MHFSSKPFFVIAGLLASSFVAQSQVFRMSREDMIEFTEKNPFDRFPDGRPKVPDNLMKRMNDVSAEEVWNILHETEYKNQWADGFQIVHPEKKLVGRVVTAQFMPMRPDVYHPAVERARKNGLPDLHNQTVIDMLQPGDVLVVDLFGKKVGGTIVGDNLFYYIYKTTRGAGLIVDGAVRDLDGISEIDMPAYFRSTDPTPIGDVMLTAINVPIRIGDAIVMPGDLAVGDKEGVYFIPPQFVKQVIDRADELHIHDEWTKKMFETGKYKSAEIYGSPKDPALKKEYEEYLKQHLAEIRKQNGE
ncbi:MAG: RraA family protein [Acidobacteriaceae bacterium]|nr:RraA family protein [Acidobacteriaceae bacterium]